jgi:hypothetical protein
MAELLKIKTKLETDPRLMTKEERWQWFLREKLNGGVIPRAKPKPKPTVTLEVEPATAAQVQARPESVRLVTMRDDDRQAVARVRPKEIVEVLEVDAEGRPKRARVVDCSTDEAGFADYQNGYRQPAGAVHEYNPLDALKRD